MLNKNTFGYIFSFLKSADLRRASLVSKEWNSVISEDSNLTLARNDCLNPLQKITIEAFLQYPLDDILESLKTQPKLLLHAYNAIFDTPKHQAVTDHKIEDVWGSIEQIRSILKHDFPQNRAESFLYGQKDGYSSYKLVKNDSMIQDKDGNIFLQNGRVISKKNIISNQIDCIIAKEPAGLLGLTNCETNEFSPAKKNDVQEYVCNYIFQKLLVKIIENSYLPESKMFSLSMLMSDGVLSERELPYLYQYFKKNKQIEIVSLCYNHINANVALSIAGLLSEFNIKKLYMRTNPLGNSFIAYKFIAEIALHPTLTDLDLSINRIGNFASSAISRMLRINNTLRKLNLYSNNIECCESIAYGLKFNESLRSLNLGCNNIGIKGAELVLAAIRDNPLSSLKTLKLYGCKLNEGDLFLFNQLLNEVKLLSLDISDNSFDEFQVIEIINTIENNDSLLKLQLCRNNIGDIGAQEIAKMLTTNISLRNLKIRACGINDSGGKAIIDSLLINKSLIKLDIACNNFSNTCLMEMAEVICMNFTLQKLDLEPSFDLSLPREVRKIQKNILEFIKQIVKRNSITSRIDFIRDTALEASRENAHLIKCYIRCLANHEVHKEMYNDFDSDFQDIGAYSQGRMSQSYS